MSMNFLFTINESYAKPIETLLFSIYDNLGPNNRYLFIYGNIGDESISELESFIANKCKGTASFVKFPFDLYLDEMPLEGKWTKEIYYRLFAPYIFFDIEKLVYLDGDTVVTGSLDEIQKLMNDDSFVIAAVKNDHQQEHLDRLGLSHQNVYINSGVLVMNLKRWRKKCSLDKMISCLLSSIESLRFPDQDFINMLWKDDLKILPRSYNYMISLTERDRSYTVISNPEICHYVFTKPWLDYFEYGTDGPYLYYLEKSGKKTEAINLRRKHRLLRLKTKIKKLLMRLSNVL